MSTKGTLYKWVLTYTKRTKQCLHTIVTVILMGFFKKANVPWIVYSSVTEQICFILLTGKQISTQRDNDNKF